MSDSPSFQREDAYRCFAQGDLDGALQQLRHLESQNGMDAQTAHDLAVVLFRLGHHRQALEYFRQAQELSGESDNVLVDNLIDALETLVLRISAEPAGSSTAVAGVPPKIGPPAATAPTAAVAPATPAPVPDAGRATREEWQADSAEALYRDAQSLSDEQWADVLFRSVSGERFRGHLLPGFISEEAQRTFVGSSGVAALQEASRFVSILLRYARTQGMTFGRDTVAIDFGSGWGRYTRFMLKYVHPDNLYGWEVNGPMVEHCRKAFGMANFLKVGTYPPAPMRDASADLAFGYSVFSHLAPQCADAWIAEFARVLRPDGLVLMTTQGRTFVEFCRQIRESGDRSNAWFEALARSFVDSDAAYREYDGGGFLHSGHGQYEGTYGESMISRGYIERNWTRHFELVDFVDDRSFLPQALFVLKRRHEDAS